MSLVAFRPGNHPQQVSRRGPNEEIDDRATTPEVFDPLDKRFGFTLDVAAAAHNTKCSRWFDTDMDGLFQSWSGETVWCNPPYSAAPTATPATPAAATCGAQPPTTARRRAATAADTGACARRSGGTGRWPMARKSKPWICGHCSPRNPEEIHRQCRRAWNELACACAHPVHAEASCDLCHEDIPVGRELCERCQTAKEYYDSLTPTEWEREWRAMATYAAMKQDEDWRHAKP